MLSTSYKTFVVMDQLRRRAGISVPQLQRILDITESSYSRLSKSVYESGTGALNADMDLKVQRAANILVSGFIQGTLFETTMPQSNEISDLLEVIEMDMKKREAKDLIKTDLSSLLSAAKGLLI